MRIAVLLPVAAALVLAACGGSDVVPDPAGPNVVSFEDGHAEMEAAMGQAKASFDWFVANWQDLPNDGYSLKVGMDTPDGSLEHIWFNPTAIDGDGITTVCANVPRNIPDLAEGDERTFSRDRTSDWMIVVGRQC